MGGGGGGGGGGAKGGSKGAASRRRGAPQLEEGVFHLDDEEEADHSELAAHDDDDDDGGVARLGRRARDRPRASESGVGMKTQRLQTRTVRTRVMRRRRSATSCCSKSGAISLPRSRCASGVASKAGSRSR